MEELRQLNDSSRVLLGVGGALGAAALALIARRGPSRRRRVAIAQLRCCEAQLIEQKQQQAAALESAAASAAEFERQLHAALEEGERRRVAIELLESQLQQSEAALTRATAELQRHKDQTEGWLQEQIEERLKEQVQEERAAVSRLEAGLKEERQRHIGMLESAAASASALQRQLQGQRDSSDRKWEAQLATATDELLRERATCAAAAAELFDVKRRLAEAEELLKQRELEAGALAKRLAAAAAAAAAAVPAAADGDDDGGGAVVEVMLRRRAKDAEGQLQVQVRPARAEKRAGQGAGGAAPPETPDARAARARASGGGAEDDDGSQRASGDELPPRGAVGPCRQGARDAPCGAGAGVAPGGAAAGGSQSANTSPTASPRRPPLPRRPSSTDTRAGGGSGSTQADGAHPAQTLPAGAEVAASDRPAGAPAAPPPAPGVLRLASKLSPPAAELLRAFNSGAATEPPAPPPPGRAPSPAAADVEGLQRQLSESRFAADALRQHNAELSARLQLANELLGRMNHLTQALHSIRRRTYDAPSAEGAAA